nr:RNA-directed DNA polymerase, eukaryota [Tanacetum cinerariifolium]
NNKDAHTGTNEHNDDIQKSVSPEIHSLSCGDQAKEQGNNAMNKDKGKNPVTITGFRDLNEEFAKCINNSSNGVSAAGPLVSTAGLDFTNITNDFATAGPLVSAAELNFTNSTNDFGVTGPSNAAMPNLEDLSHNADDVAAEANTNNMKSIISIKVEYHRCSMKTFIPACLPAFCHKRSPKESIKLLRIQVGLKPCKKSSFSSRCTKVWILVGFPYGKRAIGTKWVYRNKKDERGIVVRNKARLVAQGHTQEEGIDYEEMVFDKIVEDAWKNSGIMETKISLLKKKLQALKSVIKTWCKEDKKNSNEYRFSMQSRLNELDKLFDKGKSTDSLVIERTSLLKSLQDLNARDSLEMAQKAEIRWAIEGDENTKYFHGIINKKRSQLAIRGVLVNGDWIEEPLKVKDEFLNHFANPFSKPDGPCMTLDDSLFKQIFFDQNVDRESNVNYEEIKRAVLDCGTNKSPETDGCIFEFFRRYWNIINQDVVNAVQRFFAYGTFPLGCNSSFVTLIPKKNDAKLVKDFHPISLIGSFYKIIAKILANRLCLVMANLISDVQSAFVPNRQILDGPSFLVSLYSSVNIIELKLWSSRLILKKLSTLPSSEFSFHNGLKKGDPLSPFLFILANAISLVHTLNCFYMASGLKINIIKSMSMGIGTTEEEVNLAAKITGCSTFSSPFKYLGVKVGSSSSRNSFWDEVISKISTRPSKWKAKSLSIGGRFTLIKLILTSLPLYFMSIYKDPMGVLHKLESIRRNFFNGVDNNERKVNMIGWKKILAAKRKNGLGVSSFLLIIVRFYSSGFGDSRLIKSCFGLIKLELFMEMIALIQVVSLGLLLGFILLVRRRPGGGAEEEKYCSLVEKLNSVVLSNSTDRWASNEVKSVAIKSCRLRSKTAILVTGSCYCSSEYEVCGK